MATLGCGCKICKADLSEFTNELILNGESLKSVLDELQLKNCKVPASLLKKHLSAYSIDYTEFKDSEVINTEPIKIDLNKIDFSQYNFEPDNIESIIGFLQKINLKIYLNQALITLQAQQDVINGDCPDMPREIMQNLAVAFQILEKSTGLGVRINQQEAIKVVESLGLLVQQSTVFLPQPNAKNNPQSEAN